MTSLKPIILYTIPGGPNPYKVAILLNELGIPYEARNLVLGDGPNGVKGADFLKINPNGRVPAIIDPNNNDLKVWESGAILQYIQKKYDTEHKVSPKDDKEEAEILSWLAFQISGLGPSNGQFVWFSKSHPEKVPSAIERYLNETKRCYSVLETRLAQQGTNYVVGGRLTIADISFYPWVKNWNYIENGLKIEDYPHIEKWIKNLESRESVKKAYSQNL